MSRASFAPPPKRRSDVEVSPFGPADVKHMFRRSFAYSVDALVIWLAVQILAYTGHWYQTTALLIRRPDGHYIREGTITFATLGIADWAVLLGIALGYFAMLEWAFGCTLGKAIFGLRVVDFSGRPLAFGQAVARNAMRNGGLLVLGPLSLTWGFVRTLTDPRRRRRGDRWAGTLVVTNKALIAARAAAAESLEAAPYGLDGMPVSSGFGQSGPQSPPLTRTIHSVREAA